MKITTKTFTEVVHQTTRQGKDLILKTGKLAPHSDGAVEITLGGTQLLVTAVMNRYPDSDKDYMPLGVEYRESRYAAGKIGGGRFMKREGRPSDETVLYCRLVDRALRPMFPKGMINDVVITISPLAIDGITSPGEVSIIGASVALLLAGIPFAGPVSGVRIAEKDGKYVVAADELPAREGIMDLHVAGTANEINMIEAGGKETPIEFISDALPVAQTALAELAQIQQEFLAKCGTITEKQILKNLPSDALIDIAKQQVKDEVFTQLAAAEKADFDRVYSQTEDLLQEYLAAHVDVDQTPWTKNQVKMARFGILKERIRHRVMTEGKRIDGRLAEQIRAIYCEIDTVPRSHGSGLFRRGDTQVLSFLTLGSPGDAQLKDGMEHDDVELRFMHHYKMPPFSNNEAQMIRGTSRREIGHGRLAEKAIEAVLPNEEAFPYTIRLVSDVLGSGGSTSMASVCGSTLSLMA
ncbi:MAG: hypothetical protein Q8O99_05950 [bacterium]|nr:hypothetical protein [bacterium]